MLGERVQVEVGCFNTEDFFSILNKAAILRLDQLGGSFLPGAGVIQEQER